MLALEVKKSQGENTIDVVDGLLRAVAQLQPQLPPGMALEVVRDGSRPIRVSVANVKRTLFEGALLTVGIVFLFLNSWRSTVITGLTLPIALIGTFLFMDMFGFSINMITLMAMSLCVGLLIDDAIVVRENIVRHVQMGKGAKDAALAGTNEIGLAVLATTLSIVAVFLPIGFMSGIIGKFFHEFGITIVAAVLISMFVSFTLDPMLSSVWHDPAIDRDIDRQHGKPFQPRGLYDHTLGRVTHWVDRAAHRLGDGYEAVLGWSLVHQGATVLMALATLVAAVLLVPRLGTEFVPKADFSETSIQFYTPVGSSLANTEARAKQVDAILRAMPEVRYTLTTINTGNAAGRNYASVFVRLVDRQDRSAASTRLSVPLRDRLRQVAGITVTHVGLLDSIGGGKPISLSIQGSDITELQRLTATLMAKMASVPGLVDLDTSMKPPKPTVVVDVKRDAASDLGLSVGSITNSLRALVAGQTVGDWRAANDQTYDVKVRLAPDARDNPDDLARLSLVLGGTAAAAADGSLRSVRLGQVADVRAGVGPNQINRRDLNRESEISANTSGRALGEVSADIRQILDATPAATRLQLPLRRQHQGHAGQLRLRHLGPADGRGVHLHDPGQPVPQLPAAAGADERAAADADRRGGRAAAVAQHAQHVLGHRRDHADGPGDQERHPAGGLCDPCPRGHGRCRRPARRRPGPPCRPAAGRQGAAAADPDDHAGHGLRHAAAGLGPERRLGTACPHGPGGDRRRHHLVAADAGGGAGGLLLARRLGQLGHAPAVWQGATRRQPSACCHSPEIESAVAL